MPRLAAKGVSTMRFMHRMQCAVIGVLAAVATASAQGTPPPQPPAVPPGNMWSHGTTLNVFAGAAAARGDRAATAGGAFGWEVKPWLALEGSGAWNDWGQDAHAFAPSMTAHVSLLTRRPFVPFLAGGFGLYHASFDVDRAMPRFYGRRMMAMAGPGRTVTFTDPSVVGGGGINVFLTRHWAIRPEVLATVIVRDAHSFVMTTGAVRLAYHFEDHPVTP
jgi:hypothetical protein